MPCRVHLQNSEGEVQKPPGLPAWDDHFVCGGTVDIELTPGPYRYEVERGPEYKPATGAVDISAGRTSTVETELLRISNLRAAGWYSADLHVHRKIDEIEALMRAEDLDFAPVITWWNDENPWEDQPAPKTTSRQFDGHRIYTLMAGEDERNGGALLYFGLRRPLDISGSGREFPSPMSFVAEARKVAEANETRVWIDIEKPFWWDVPVWLASGQMNSVGLANNHMCRSQMYENEAWGKPRDEQRLPPPRGNGYWTQELYYHILNAGIRIPPSAGSASGVLSNPVGYNRVYVFLDEPFSQDAWWDSLAAGRCFVTNGPLLIAQANNSWPGSVLQIPAGAAGLDVEIEVNLTSNDRISQVELVHNGETVQTVKCSDDTVQSRRLSYQVTKPGWMLVRCVTDRQETFRFGSTAPWYIESHDRQRRVSRSSSQFFLSWVNQRIEDVRENVTDESQRRSVLRWHEEARAFWHERVRNATDE